MFPWWGRMSWRVTCGLLAVLVSVSLSVAPSLVPVSPAARLVPWCCIEWAGHVVGHAIERYCTWDCAARAFRLADWAHLLARSMR